MSLISFPEWRQWVPEAVMLRLDRFYHVQTDDAVTCVKTNVRQ